MANLPDATGGTFYHNATIRMRFQEFDGEPEVVYVLELSLDKSSRTAATTL